MWKPPQAPSLLGVVEVTDGHQSGCVHYNKCCGLKPAQVNSCGTWGHLVSKVSPHAAPTNTRVGLSPFPSPYFQL